MEPADAHVRRELDRLDVLLQREILRLRGRYQLSLDELRGLYISHEQVDDLLAGPGRAFDPLQLTLAADALRSRNRRMCPPDSGWRRLTADLRLSALDEDLLVLTLAPEVDPKYESLFAYLNNDVAGRYVTRDLACRIFRMHDEADVRRALLPESPLLAGAVLRESGAGVVAGRVVARHVLASGAPPIAPLARAVITAPDRPDDPWNRAADCLGPSPLLVFTGADAHAIDEAAHAVAAHTSRPLLVLDARDVPPESETRDLLVAEVALQTRVERAILLITDGDAWFDRDDRPSERARRLVRGLADVPVILSCPETARWREVAESRRAMVFAFGPPASDVRHGEWLRAAADLALPIEIDTADDLARRFSLTAHQIHCAAQTAADAAATDLSGDLRAALFDAARTQCGGSLAQLAGKLTTTHRWADLVVPTAVGAQLRAATGAIAHRHVVYETWRMAPRSGGSGLNLLFSGPSGTGKTMSAGIMAAELELDLYRVDLSGLVSKYIGETEKNLDRVFAAARASNAMLFFDEADALFGKRSDVKEAQDRYANIEVAYLLQKMEAHDGVVILATNLAGNIDEAFARRMQFVIDFPLPDRDDRHRLWQRAFPAEAPVAPDVDLLFLAQQFQLSGGQIRGISLDAAFLAAQNGRLITMRHIISALGRLLIREGRMPMASDFKQHYSLLAAGS